MRHGNTGRRSRNRNNNGRRSNNNRTQVFDSNGPEVRIRGTAHQVFDKYTALAKDAASAGDRVLAESYYQYAEHYKRIVNDWEETLDDHLHGRVREDKNVDRKAPQKASSKDDDLGLPDSIIGNKTKENSEKQLEEA